MFYIASLTDHLILKKRFSQDFSLPRLLVTSEFNGQYPHELTCKKGEIILLISKTIPGYVVNNVQCYISITLEMKHVAANVLPQSSDSSCFFCVAVTFGQLKYVTNKRKTR